MEETSPSRVETADPKAYTFSFRCSVSGPGIPAKAQVLDFIKSLDRKELYIGAGILAFILIVEPLFFYLLFNARLTSRLERNNADLITNISTQVRADFLSSFRENIMMQSTQPMKPIGSDPANMIVPPSQENSEIQKGGPITQPAPPPSPKLRP
jgi:hypothetical protein